MSVFLHFNYTFTITFKDINKHIIIATFKIYWIRHADMYNICLVLL